MGWVEGGGFEKCRGAGCFLEASENRWRRWQSDDAHDASEGWHDVHQKGLDTAHQAEYFLYGGVPGCTAAFDTILQKVLLHLMWEALTPIFENLNFRLYTHHS